VLTRILKYGSSNISTFVHFRDTPRQESQISQKREANISSQSQKRELAKAAAEQEHFEASLI
jgi:hypothetical protein